MDFDVHFPEGLFNGSIPRADLEAIIQKTHSAYLKLQKKKQLLKAKKEALKKRKE